MVEACDDTVVIVDSLPRCKKCSNESVPTGMETPSGQKIMRLFRVTVQPGPPGLRTKQIVRFTWRRTGRAWIVAR